MRYRRLDYRYTMVVTGQLPPFGEAWRIEQLSVPLAQPRWRPFADVYETAEAITVTVELAGVDQEDLEVLLFEDALVVEGRRRPPACEEGGVYRVAQIRQGPFRVEVHLPGAVDRGRVDARYDHGLLCITLPKAGGR